MRHPCSACSRFLQARRQSEKLRDLTVADTADLKRIAREAQHLPSDQDEYVAEFTKDVVATLHRVDEHIKKYTDVFVEQLDRFYK